MKKIKLTKEEIELLLNIMEEQFPWSNLELKITDFQREKIMDYLGTKLQKHGFDKNYELNKIGSIIEGLIDKLSDS